MKAEKGPRPAPRAALDAGKGKERDPRPGSLWSEYDPEKSLALTQ